MEYYQHLFTHGRFSGIMQNASTLFANCLLNLMLVATNNYSVRT